MVTIRVAEGRLELQAPYHPVLPFRSKQIGGKWLWRRDRLGFSSRRGTSSSHSLPDIWAVDGTPGSLEETVELQIAVDERAPVRSVFVAYQSPIFLVGREIAASLKNRRGARPGRGVKFLTGKPRCISSSNSWMTTIPNGSVFIISNVAACTIGRFREALGEAGHVEIRARER